MVLHSATMSAARRRRKMVPSVSDEFCPNSMHLLKRVQLQQQCKKLGLKAIGKTTEMLERLRDHYKRNRLNGSSSTDEVMSETEQFSPKVNFASTTPQLSKTQIDGHGWCVVHGMELLRPPSSWALLVLKNGRVCVPDGDKCIPLHLKPSMNSMPPELEDNFICEECVKRNQEKDMRQEQLTLFTESKGDGVPRRSCATPYKGKRHPSGKYCPKENADYARKVEELLNKMAAGEVDFENVIQPRQPAVVHSPQLPRSADRVTVHKEDERDSITSMMALPQQSMTDYTLPSVRG
ncbi:developmental pluripotency-associated protein 2-like [Protopterus annectens]|uniref:developmental pluripotency-associated protein 2-like n=1 Tax=Protopterus annectens TaxID=7888 RepID=UPI001CFB6AC3|nr:developmental pluripotency-associated protein 2-like [Protopterus annectens]XP_043942250.1 developmental pluripotency-associated protein 2-like [Protopterus annectens]